MTTVVGGAVTSSSVAIVAAPTIVPEMTAQVERKMSGFNRHAPLSHVALAHLDVDSVPYWLFP